MSLGPGAHDSGERSRDGRRLRFNSGRRRAYCAVLLGRLRLGTISPAPAFIGSSWEAPPLHARTHLLAVTALVTLNIAPFAVADQETTIPTPQPAGVSPTPNGVGSSAQDRISVSPAGFYPQIPEWATVFEKRNWQERLRRAAVDHLPPTHESSP